MENTNIKNFQIKDLLEDDELNDKIVKSFKIKNTLSPVIFENVNGDIVMDDNVRNKLLETASLFLSTLDFDLFVYDILLVGSLSNYNWSEYSDVDLHILIDFNDILKDTTSNIEMLLRDYFNSKKTIWNNKYDIQIKKYDVEIYVQDVSDINKSDGVYSILNNEWLKKPTKTNLKIDKNKILNKANLYTDIIDHLTIKANMGVDIKDEIEVVKEKLKKMRKSGLEKGGEYSYENLAFKLLRRNGYIKKLYELKNNVISNNLSITQ